ncbi:hypothetical protein ACFZDJ_44165 [Streptomyces sp. NPDC007896]|uniref:hypothetical protein n=1 Tax=unclassified Streptomyces TaxID=2593676 RepID=UPI0036E25B78
MLLIGDADPLADHEALAHTAKSLPRARLSVVHGAHHDVLNDLQHRSVAAEVVTFLETLRNELRPLITVRSSTWGATARPLGTCEPRSRKVPSWPRSCPSPEAPPPPPAPHDYCVTSTTGSVSRATT